MAYLECPRHRPSLSCRGVEVSACPHWPMQGQSVLPSMHLSCPTPSPHYQHMLSLIPTIMMSRHWAVAGLPPPPQQEPQGQPQALPGEARFQCKTQTNSVHATKQHSVLQVRRQWDFSWVFLMEKGGSKKGGSRSTPWRKWSKGASLLISSTRYMSLHILLWSSILSRVIPDVPIPRGTALHDLTAGCSKADLAWLTLWQSTEHPARLWKSQTKWKQLICCLGWHLKTNAL